MIFTATVFLRQKLEFELKEVILAQTIFFSTIPKCTLSNKK